MAKKLEAVANVECLQQLLLEPRIFAEAESRNVDEGLRIFDRLEKRRHFAHRGGGEPRFEA